MTMVTVMAFPTTEERDNDVRDNAITLGSTTDPHKLAHLLNSGTESHPFVGYYVADKKLDGEAVMKSVGGYLIGDYTFVDKNGNVVMG